MPSKVLPYVKPGDSLPRKVTLEAPDTLKRHMFSADFSRAPFLDNNYDFEWIKDGLLTYFSEKHGDRYDSHVIVSARPYNVSRGFCDVDVTGELFLKEPPAYLSAYWQKLKMAFQSFRDKE